MDKIASVHGFAEKKLSFTNSLVVGGVIQSQLEVFRSAKRQNATDRNFNEQLLHVNNSLDCTRNGVSLIISGKHAASHPPISINEQSHLTIA